MTRESTLCLVILTLLATANCRLEDVRDLNGEGDYRSVKLSWRYPESNNKIYGFQVHYCELQAWGNNRCNTKLVDGSSNIENKGDSDFKNYSMIIKGLRMATNYSFEVKPVESRKTRYLGQENNSIIVNTKGFSAEARVCLPDVSEIQVWTGPYFSGRVTVEHPSSSDTQYQNKQFSTIESSCSLEGKSDDPKTSYILRIDHHLCGSTVINSTAIATYVLVQENLPILTHSTRRFLVLCTFQPLNLTVRAGLNLPSTSPASGYAEPEKFDQLLDENDLYEIHRNDVRAAPLQQKISTPYGDETEAQVVIATIAIIAGIIGISLTVWWFYTPRVSNGDESILSEECATSVCDNYDNILRDSLNGNEANNAIDAEERLRAGAINTVLCQMHNNTENSSVISIQCGRAINDNGHSEA